MCDIRLTIAAIAVLAICVTTIFHEALGHGSVCLAWGGEILNLTSVYFDCSKHDVWVTAAGPLGNLAAALLSWLALRNLKDPPALRLLLLLVLTLSLFWTAGYLVYSAVLEKGDNAIVAQAIFGAPAWPWRIGLFVLAVLLYVLGGRLLAHYSKAFAERRFVLRLSYAAATAAAIIAAAFYEPDRGNAILQSGLEIGAASWPLLFTKPKTDISPGVVVPSSAGWITAGAIGFVLFIATLGRGLQL